MVCLMTGCLSPQVMIRVPPPCPLPGAQVAAQWNQLWVIVDDDSDDALVGHPIYVLAPAVGHYMGQLKQYCRGIDEFRKPN